MKVIVVGFGPFVFGAASLSDVGFPVGGVGDMYGVFDVVDCHAVVRYPRKGHSGNGVDGFVGQAAGGSRIDVCCRRWLGDVKVACCVVVGVAPIEISYHYVGILFGVVHVLGDLADPGNIGVVGRAVRGGYVESGPSLSEGTVSFGLGTLVEQVERGASSQLARPKESSTAVFVGAIGVTCRGVGKSYVIIVVGGEFGCPGKFGIGVTRLLEGDDMRAVGEGGGDDGSEPGFGEGGYVDGGNA